VLSVQVVRPASPLVLHIPLVFCAGEPKDVFSASLAHPFTSIILIFIITREDTHASYVEAYNYAFSVPLRLCEMSS